MLARVTMSIERTSRVSRWLAVVGLSTMLGLGVTFFGACGSEPDAPPGAAEAGIDASIDVPSIEEASIPPDAISDAGADASSCLDSSPDADIDCTGKCGPVKDLCTGKTKQCGGCANRLNVDGGDAGPQVCDLVTNSCGVPKITCGDLGAECGTVKNSCGEYLDCPDSNPKGCAAGKECDPDTRKCRDCQPVTCKDLGIECGSAWLGCGEDTPANYTDCGSCGAAADGGAQKCNGVFHTCEPSCVPKPAADLCNDAKLKKGLECGVISNGCGGTVNCDAVATFGCPSGESCGVRGIANRCDTKATPDECKASGKNCGEITSACGGAKIKCGDCATGQVCNANGVCGAPCTPKTCADFSAFECGTFDDTCGGTLTCGACVNGICNNTTKSCCATNTCGAAYAGKCGADLANGCGQNVLDCNCTNPATCTADGGVAPIAPTSTAGLCYTPKTSASYAGQCGTNLSNGCGLQNINVGCPANQFCVNNGTGQPGPAPANGVPGSCCVQTNVCPGAPSCAAIQNSCRTTPTNIACNGNCASGTTCNNNTCCVAAAACPGGGGENAECNTVKPANGCGNDRACNCGGGRTCWCTNHQCVAGADPAGVCKSALTCTSPSYNNMCGTGLPNGLGGTIGCGCATGKVCSTSTPGQVGTCNCANGSGAPYTCANVPAGPGQAGGDQCGPFSNGCGGTLSCTCPVGQTCNTAANPNACCSPATCPAQALGSACGNLSNNCGGTIACGCPSGIGNENVTCSSGTCQCVKDTCRGRTGPQPDRCGGTLQCGG